jgi:16S rRNA (uracil1498-N3)-methyltransferase
LEWGFFFSPIFAPEMKLPDLLRIYHPDAHADRAITLDHEDAKHVKVLRLKDGDRVHVVDGKGRLYEGTVSIEKRDTRIHSLTLVLDQSAKRPSGLTLAVAPTKNIARFEWVIEKATEVGVSAIVPLITDHSERVHLRHDRLERIAISAMKQSKELFLPLIANATAFDAWLSSFSGKGYIAHCHDHLEKTSLHHMTETPVEQSLSIAIGPEGDFSEAEVRKAMQHKMLGLDLGTRRLRTETAAITAVIAASLLRK